MTFYLFFIGFESQEIPVATQTTIDVQMLPSTQELSEVVVIGYGEREKERCHRCDIKY